MPVDNLDEGSTSPETSDEDVKVLAEGEEEEEASTPEAAAITEEEEEEVEAKEEETTEEDEEEEEETPETQITRPSWNELKEKYPGIEKNKEFREVYFREKAFSEVFPTLEEAKDSAEKARVFEFFNESLADGSPDTLVRNLNPQALEGFAGKVLPALKATNKDLFLKATAPVIVDIVNNIQEYAVAKGDKNLETSVGNICKWLFGDFKVPPRIGGKVDPEIEKEKKSLQEERERLSLSQRQDFTGKIEKSIGRQLEKIVREGLEVKNEFLANTITEKTLTRVKETITGDKEFLNRLANIYKQAERGGYPPEYATRVISAYIGRAKGIALKARAEIKSTALGKQSTKEASENPTKRVVRTEKGNGEVGKDTGKKVDLRSTRNVSDLDIINQR